MIERPQSGAIASCPPSTRNLIALPPRPPDGLPDRDRWVCWVIDWDLDGKPTKVPVNAKSCQRASVTNPNDWTSYERAVAGYQTFGLEGIGLVFDAGDRLSGVDLDKCRDLHTGQLDARATRIVQDLASYTEVSPSGKGVHILAWGSLPLWGRRCSGIEIYGAGRYFTFT